MVTRRASDATAPSSTPTAIAPVVKRKRRASCLGEQERRERKRAIDREAQRSLREKTKTHIAELERTIQILRDQDQNGATASLLSEIDALRAENERLRDVIDSVKSVVGCDIFTRSSNNASSSMSTAPKPAVQRNSGANAAQSDGAASSPGANGEGQSSTQHPQSHPTSSTPPLSMSRARTNSIAANADLKPTLPTPSSIIADHPMTSHYDTHHHPVTFSHPHQQPYHHHLRSSASVDLDGMTVLPPHHNPSLLNLDPVFEMDEPPHLSDHNSASSDTAEAPDSPNTAAFAPYMDEIFGHNWRCPSPVILHLPDAVQAGERAQSASPMWKVRGLEELARGLGVAGRPVKAGSC
ncbi:hypothetical protein M011DRAFT_522863 [Sporormia fimetaria CBS 119925]|uniref:BZIP domain-containing protein n=1 Tax=Sporormia fimetaria CBS 119925 TaxID=1340428 RepID=A0A6A6VMY8_9PLEO|nr:hypothetical protein M011DRAFT_522863 [Sporormia fimetaria CBS 119925]